MKAIVYSKYGPTDVLSLIEVDRPIPKDDQVLIKNYAAVVSATDTIFRKGDPFISRFATGLLKPKYPIPGDALAGEIEATGKDVTLFKKGDPVFGSTGAGFGAHATYVCMPEKGALSIKPVNMTYEEAAAVCDGGLTALPFLRDTANINRGQKILINGASGSIGTFAIQIAKYFGAEVTSVCSKANLELAQSLGSDKVIDYTREDFTQNGETYDIIFDAVGKSTFSKCKKSLVRTGVYCTTVLTLPIIMQMLWTSLFGGKKARIAFTGARPANERVKDLKFLRELIEAGKIKSIIDKNYALEEIAQAHGYVEQGHKKGNVVITMTHQQDK